MRRSKPGRASISWIAWTLSMLLCFAGAMVVPSIWKLSPCLELMSGIPVLFTRAAVLAAALLFSAPARAADATFIVKWRADERNTNSAYVEVAGIPAAGLRALKARPPNAPEWTRLLSVYVHDD